MILTTLVVLSEKLPLLSDSESGESMSPHIIVITLNKIQKKIYREIGTVLIIF